MGDAKIEAIKPKTVGPASADAPDVAAADPAGEAPMFPRVIEVVAVVISSSGVADPLAVVMDVRSFGVVGLIAILDAWRGFLTGRFLVRRVFVGRVFRPSHRAMNGRRTMFRNVSATYSMTATATLVTMLRQGWQAKDQRYRENQGEKSHEQPPTDTLPSARFEEHIVDNSLHITLS